MTRTGRAQGPKFKALAEGARIASARLWSRGRWKAPDEPVAPAAADAGATG